MKTIKFLYDMVEGDFYSFRTYGRDVKTEELAAQIMEAEGRQELFISAYAELVVYTHALRFAWRDGVPDELRALETFWNMRANGATELEAFRFYTENVSNSVMLGVADDGDADRVMRGLRRIEIMRADGGDWQKYYVERVAPLVSDGRPAQRTWIDAKNEALRRWVPPEWRLADELTDEERADPNSDSDSLQPG